MNYNAKKNKKNSNHGRFVAFFLKTIWKTRSLDEVLMYFNVFK